MKNTIALAAALCALAAHAGGWRAKTFSPDDSLRLAELEGGVLRVDYSLSASNERLSGCTRYTGGWADVLLAEPAPLASDARRIVFELKGTLGRGEAKASMSPIVEDSDGERFVYAYRKAPHLAGGDGCWTLFTTPDFLAGEAGAAAQDVYELDGDGVDFTPDGAMRLVGFRVAVRRESGDVPRYDGTFFLGGWKAMGVEFPDEPPFAYADAVFPREGRFTLACSVRDAFQALPLAEWTEKRSFHAGAPSYEAERKRRVEFPLGAGCTIEAVAFGADGSEELRRSWRHDARAPIVRAADVRRVDAATKPPAGVMRIGPCEKARGVRERGDESPLEVRLFPSQGESFDVAWKVMPCVCTNILYEGSASVPGEGKPFASVMVPVHRLEGRDAYRLAVSVRLRGREIERGEYFFGFRSDPSERHDRVGATTDRRELKKRPYNRTTFLPRREAQPYSEEEVLSEVAWHIDESSEFSRHFTYMVDLRDFEVLPGVLDTVLLDRVLDLAADRGCKVTVRAAHCDLGGTNLYRWEECQRQISYDGTVASGHPYYGAYSVSDPRTTSLWLGFYRALHARYAGHTAFEGYYVMQPGGEWTVVDQPWDGTFTGYDAATAEGFARWREARGRKAVKPPMPDFALGAKPDLREEWMDFCRYKRSLGGEWMKQSVGDIRSYDDERVTIAYCAPDEVARLLGDRLDYAHNGGNHYGDHLGDFVEAWEKFRVGWITEPHHPHAWAAYGDPGQAGWVLHWSVWVMTAQAAGGGANLHVYFNPWGGDCALAAYGGSQAYDMMEALKPVLDELHEMEMFRERPEIGFFTDEATLFAKHRTTFQARLADLRRWRELIEDDVLPYRECAEGEAAGVKLALPNILDEVMFKSTYDALVECVKGGAKLVMTARTGSYVPELGTEEPYRLLTAFGIPAPKGEFCRKGAEVRATAAKESDLFPEGFSFPVETSDRQRAQLLDPAVQGEFWKYRWRFIPETDYFGYHPGVKAGGEVLASFADGGDAVTRHRFGKGEVVVFWGVPDICGENMKGFMKRAARWAGVDNPLEHRELRYCLEGRNAALGRHYLLAWQEKPGAYRVIAPHCPDGTFFMDDPISCERLGTVDGKELREKGVRVEWSAGRSPLRFLRLIPRRVLDARCDWAGKYP